MLAQIAIISINLSAFVLLVVSFVCFKNSQLRDANSVRTTGKLVGFRKYYFSDKKGNKHLEYADNKRGRVPLVEISIDGEKVTISSVIPDSTYTKEDINKTVQVRYRRFVGITLAIDNGEALKKYNKSQERLFWIFNVASVLLIMSNILFIWR